MNSTAENVANRFRQPAPADALRAFQTEIVERLNQPLPPHSPAPALTVCVGPADPAVLTAIRAQLPASVLLVWVCPAPSTAGQSASLAAASRSARAVVCELDTSGHYLDKVGLAVAMLPDVTVQLNAVSTFRQSHSGELATLDREIRAIRESMELAKARGIFRLRYSLQNLPSMIRNRSRVIQPLERPGAAIICSGGAMPAADTAALRQASGRALLIAAGRAVPELVRHGIQPDIVVETDGFCSHPWPDDVRPTGLLAAAADVSPSVAARFERAWWFQGSSSEANVLLARLGLCLPVLRLGRSVTVSAIELALQLNCRQLALVGEAFSSGANGGAASPEAVRETLEEYLALVVRPNWPDVVVMDCSNSGAAIQGAPRGSLEVWQRELPPVAAASVVTGEASGGFPVGTLLRFSERLNECRAACEAILGTCKNLAHQLSAGTFDPVRVRALQVDLGQKIQREAALQQDEVLQILLSPIVQHAERLVRGINGLDLNSQDPFIQMAILSTRYRLVRDLAADLCGDIESVARTQSTDAPAVPAVATTWTGGFRSFGVAMLKQGSPALAAWLEAHPMAVPDTRFNVTVMNQTLAYVQHKRADGDWHPLSSYHSMHEDARREVEQFLATSNYDAKRHAVLLVGPGNWSCPYELARLHPSAELCIVEPWPELLSLLMANGCFFHAFHPRTRVVAAGPSCEPLLSEVLAGWQKAGRTPLLFVPRHLRGIHEVETLAGWLRREGRTS